jgi:hypothetical protein
VLVFPLCLVWCVSVNVFVGMDGCCLAVGQYGHSCRLFIVTTCFSITGHHQMCRLLWRRVAVHFNAVFLFLYNCLGLILGYVGQQAVAMHVFALWFCWFVDLSSLCVSGLNVLLDPEVNLGKTKIFSTSAPLYTFRNINPFKSPHQVI